MAIATPELKDLLEARNKHVTNAQEINERVTKAAKGWSAEDSKAFADAQAATETADKVYKEACTAQDRDKWLSTEREKLDTAANNRITDPNSHNNGANARDGAKKVVEWNSVSGTPDRRNRQMNRKMVKSGVRSTDAYRDAFNRYLAGADGLTAFHGFNEKAFNTAGTISSEDEQRMGYFVTSEDFAEGILRTVDDEVFIQQLARVIYIKTARSLGIRKRTAKATAFGWGSELSDVTNNLETTLRFGKRVLTPHYATGAARISRDLLRNAVEDPESIVMYELGINLREFLEQAYLLGDGVEKPLGLLVNNVDGITTARDFSFAATTSTFTFDTFQDAKYRLKPQYRNKAKWMINRAILAAVAMLKTSQGVYLWQPSKIVGEPDTILGLPYVESEWFPSAVGASNYFAMLGDFSYYTIAFAMDLEVQRLNEIAARTNEVEYHLRLKVDAQPTLEEAFVRLAYAAS